MEWFSIVQQFSTVKVNVVSTLRAEHEETFCEVNQLHREFKDTVYCEMYNSPRELQCTNHNHHKKSNMLFECHLNVMVICK